MKLTRRQLRKLIKEMAWDPSTSKTVHPNFSMDPPLRYKAYLEEDPAVSPMIRHYRRALGILSKAESEEEKKIIADYQKANAIEIQKFYKELQKPLDTAQITCLHGLDYEGAYTDKQHDHSAKSWIQKFGSSGRDQISTVMLPFEISEMHKVFKMPTERNTTMVLSENGSSYALILGGFPVMMNYNDMMTQTLSNLHPDLVKFQASSGISKSSEETPDIDNYESFITKGIPSEETVLDNWFVKGVHYTLWEQQSLEQLSQAAEECKDLNLPLYVTERGDLSKGTYRYS